jgi:hypothetical protein
MKKLFTKVFAIASVAFLSVSCNKTNDAEPTDDGQEFRYVRLLVSDETSNQITLVNPRDLTVQTFQAKFPKSAVYTTESGRFAGLIHRESNMLETFDSGFEPHGDHVDVKGTPKFGALMSESKLPTHFKSKKGEIMTFNDGDGTLSVGKEADVHMSGMRFKQIPTGNVAHHGAMATFLNGTYAITEKDGSIAGTLPERVKIIDNTGKLLFTSKIATKGIHGNATDGKYAVFGSASGILVVEATGEQKLIPHPTDFGTAWFGTIYETSEAGKFVGYTAAKGAYSIEVASGKITPIIENTTIMQCKMDFSENTLVALLHNGNVNIYDVKTNKLKTSGKIMDATATDEKQKPQLVATDKSLYVTLPKTGEIMKIETGNLANIQKIKVSSTPYRITVLGAEMNRKGEE